MSSSRVASARRLRRLSLIALGLCVAWLLLQNSLLLLWISSPHLVPWLVAARALARVGMHLAAELWMLPVAVILGVALAITGVERGVAKERARGVSHV